MGMAKVLDVGSGGREHRLAESLAGTPGAPTVYTAPSNAGTPKNVSIDASTPSGLSRLAGFVEGQSVDLTVVGQDVPLCAGLADFLSERRLLAFRPSQRSARLESDKDFARQFLRRHGIPHPSFEAFTSPSDAARYVRSLPEGPIVVEACGLAQGKGVYVCEDRGQAESSVRALMIERQLGAAGEAIPAEELAVGEEATVTAIADGQAAVYLSSSEDHKRV